MKNGSKSNLGLLLCRLPRVQILVYPIKNPISRWLRVEERALVTDDENLNDEEKLVKPHAEPVLHPRHMFFECFPFNCINLLGGVVCQMEP